MESSARPKFWAYRRAFGNRLRDLRLANGASQDTLAYETGIARSYVGGIERGEKNPALDHIVRLARALQVQPGDLMPTLPLPLESPHRPKR